MPGRENEQPDKVDIDFRMVSDETADGWRLAEEVPEQENLGLKQDWARKGPDWEDHWDDGRYIRLVDEDETI